MIKQFLAVMFLGLVTGAQASFGQWSGDANAPILVTREDTPLHATYSDGEGGFTVLFGAFKKYSLFSRHFDKDGFAQEDAHEVGWPASVTRICRGLDNSVWSAYGDPSTGLPTVVRLDRFGRKGGPEPLTLGDFPIAALSITHDGSGGAFVFFCNRDSSHIFGNGVNSDYTVKFKSPILYDDSTRLFTPPRIQALADGQGGAFLWYEQDRQVKIRRISADGEEVWNGPFDLSLSNSDGGLAGIHADSLGGVFLVWNEDFKIQVLNISKNRVIRRYSYEIPNLSSPISWQSATTPHGDLVLIYNTYEGYTERFYLQRFTDSGEQLLEKPPILMVNDEHHLFGLETVMCLADSHVYFVRQFSDLNFDAAFLASKFDLNGNAMWQPTETKLAVAPSEPLYDRTLVLTKSREHLALSWSIFPLNTAVWMQGVHESGGLLRTLSVEESHDALHHQFEFEGVASIIVFDLLGREVSAFEADDDEMARSIARLPPGRYIVRVGGVSQMYQVF